MATRKLDKPKYKVEDSNVALIGSDLNHKVRKAASETETAWLNAGKQEGTQVWRIEKFQVKDWPRNQYGSFYEGDSYIVLHTFKEGPQSTALSHQIHFWLGQSTTQDEAGTAAYKTVELDDFLGGKAHQHREVMGYESETFLGLFGHIKILAGGIETGFHHVAPEKYEPRLLHLRQTLKKKHIRIVEVALTKEELNEGDVFIVDCGMKIYQFNGKHCPLLAKRKGGEICHSLKDERHSKPTVIVVEQDEKSADASELWALFGGASAIKSVEAGRSWEKEHNQFASAPKRLLQLSNETGTMEMKIVAEGGHNIKKNMLNPKHIMMFDSGSEVFVWVGSHSNAAERKSALGYAQNYLTQHKRPAHLPIHKIYEGGKNETFNSELEVN